MPIRKKSEQHPYEHEPISTFGCQTKGQSQLFYDQYAFAQREEGHGAPSRPELFRRMAEHIVPGHFEWHDWTNRTVDALCRRRWVGMSGCSNAAKSWNVGSFAAIWWMADPANSSVICCSTTMKMLRKKVWSHIQGFAAKVERRFGEVGNFVNSQTVWQFQQGDDLHAIFGIAVQEGDTNKVATNIQGLHTRRQMVIIDEAEAVPAAIWKVCANLYSYPIDSGGEFILVAIANGRSRLSQFGRFIEPLGGWDTVSVDTDEWESVPQMDGKRALVLRFDFRKSPNIVEGKTVSRHLPTKARVESRLAALKARNAENDPEHWCYDLGFPPPEGMAKTVFSETLIVKHGGFEQHQFTGSNWMIIGAFDQARTGNRAALRFAALGDIAHNKMGIEWMPPIVLFPDATSKEPIGYQILRQLRAQCESVKYRGNRYVCLPGSLGIDVSNEATFGDLCQREWSPDIIRIMFGAAASEEPASMEDQRPASSVYRNKRAEMFFRARSALEAGQLKGIDKDTAVELCSLEYSEMRPDGTRKPITIQDKKEYVLKFGKSPDYADCFVAGTLVLTPSGNTPIEKLAVGDKVITPFGVRTIIRTIVQSVSELTRVDFSNGAKLIGKGKHRVFTFDKGWVRMDQLSLTTIIESDRHLWIWNILNSCFGRDESIGFKAAVDIIKTTTGLRRIDFFTALSGLRRMVRFLQNIASTIKTASGGITGFPIWNSCRFVSICNTTCGRGSPIPILDALTSCIYEKPSPPLPLGTVPKRDLNGTEITPSASGKTSPRLNDDAPSAENNSMPTKVNLGSNAPTNAGREQGGQNGSRRTVWKELASFAAKSIRALNLVPDEVVPSRVETESGPERLVYNLTLDRDNVYYANGILVENCGVMIQEVARIKGFRIIATGHTVNRSKEFEELVEKADAVYDDIQYAEEEPMVEDEFSLNL